MPRHGSFRWDKAARCYRTQIGGRLKRFPGIARDDVEAIAAAFAAYKADLFRQLGPAEPTAEEVCAAFVEASPSRGVVSRTARTHSDRLAAWIGWMHPKDGEYVGTLRASAVESRHLKGALLAWEQAGRSAHYRAGICRSVKAAWAWAASEEGGRLIPANPLKEVKGPEVGQSPERYTERPEVAAFLRFILDYARRSTPAYRHFARQLALMVRVAAHTGARPGDLAAAWWGDVDPSRGTITLPADRHKTGHKTRRPRVIYLPPDGTRGSVLLRALLRLRGRVGPDGSRRSHPVAIFAHKRGRGSGDVGDVWQGEPWGDFVTLPDGRPSFVDDTGPLCKAIRRYRKAAVAEAARRRAAGEPLRGLDLVRDDGRNRFVMYQLRHTSISDDLMGGEASATTAALHGTSGRMVETTYGHILDKHLVAAAGKKGRRRGG